MDSIYKNNYIKFEHYCIREHQNNYPNEITYHWSNIPEEILVNSGFITDYHNMRIKRKNDYDDNKLNSIKEYGLDGISYNKINNTYNVLQIKCYEPNSVIDASTLGSFISCFFQRINFKYPESNAYLYHTCKISRNLEIDILNSGKIKIIKINNIDNIINNDILIENNILENLRYYQIEALNCLNDNLTNDYIPKLLLMPDGTGKKRLINEYLNNKDYKYIIIISSLKSHAENIKIKLNNKKILSLTYESLPSFLLNYDNDLTETILIAIDCHNLNNELVEIIKKFPNILLSTSSPEIKINEIINCELIYEYKFSDAIKDCYICDYVLYLPVIEENTNKDNIPIELKSTITDIDDNIYKKALFLINGLLQKGSRNCVAFMTSINECYLFEDVVKNIMEKYIGLPYKTYSITCDTNCSERKKIINDFDKYDYERMDTIKILCSIRILDENINLIKCDSVFISNLTENSNNIKILQRISKGNRIDINNINKICNCFIWTDNIYNSISILETLKYNDVNFENKIKYMSKNYDKNKDIKIVEKIKKDTQDVSKFININCMSIIDFWRNNINLVKKYIDEYGKNPCGKLNRFITIQNKYYNLKIGIMKNIEIYNEYSDFLKKYYDIDYKCNLLFEYCNKNGKIPSKKECIWFYNEKEKIKSINDNIYKKLSKNEYVKKELNKIHNIFIENYSNNMYDIFLENKNKIFK